MSYVPRISRLQFFFIFAISNICITPFGFPALILKQLGHHAWISVVVAFVMTVWNLYVAIALAKQFPKQNIVEWSMQILGKWFGGLFSLLIILILYFWAVGMIWAFWHLIMFTQLAYTPIYLPALLIIGGVVYLLWQGIETFARFAEVTIIFIFFGLIIVNAVQFYNADFARLLPINHMPFKHMLSPNTIGSLFVFRGIFIVYFLYKYLNNTKRTLSLSIYSLFIAFVEILLAVIMPIAIYGAHASSLFTYPYQESISSASINLVPFEKVTFITPMLWQIIMVYVIGSSLFCANEGLASMFRIKKKNRLLLIIGIITWIFAAYQVSYAQLNRWMMIWSLAGLVIFTIIPTLIWIYLSLRRLLKS